MTTVTRQIHFAMKARRRVAMPGPAPEPVAPAGRIPRVSKLMALAIRFDQLLFEGRVADQSELARLAHVTQPRMTQIMNLLHLAPDIQEEILHLPQIKVGKDLLIERDLRPITRLRDWREQRQYWRDYKRTRFNAALTACQSGAGVACDHDQRIAPATRSAGSPIARST